MDETTCGHPSDNPVMVIMSNGKFESFCDTECLARWIEEEDYPVLAQVWDNDADAVYDEIES